ncbi:hypothetical protein [Varunaivibrio sulfuroxidans]|uniref:Tryptophan synthase subunit beta like protein n=1 Tax=Varunaivibrio sulfuroxidans TaxID=1773489 RepID=A0A4R3J9V5_9PROT|nr:hypothetical protein [Varunaivibrio sulfuroxidans]TCS62668.1 hypothetical protein EDD55_105217 [Varunaivibrio sulfuroxidans]WES30668.1 hypothetical protein P3M64_13695 [Varunaivibrio sulfuroxidans]
MPYIMRNAEGRIIAVLSEEVEGSEFVAANDHELTSFLQNDSPEARAQQELLESDLGIIRILEDLIDILIERGAIMFSDFPEPAQRKLLARRGLRKEFAYMDDLFGGGEDALPQTDADEDGLF